MRLAWRLFSDSQLHRGGNAAGSNYYRGRAILGLADHPGECDASGELRAKSSDKAGRKTGDVSRRCHRGAAHTGPRALPQLEQPAAEQRNLLVAASLTSSGQKIYALLSFDDPRPIDDIVERTGLNSSDVLATLFDLEMKGFIPQLPGKQFSKIMF